VCCSEWANYSSQKTKTTEKERGGERRRERERQGDCVCAEEIKSESTRGNYRKGKRKVYGGKEKKSLREWKDRERIERSWGRLRERQKERDREGQRAADRGGGRGEGGVGRGGGGRSNEIRQQQVAKKKYNSKHAQRRQLKCNGHLEYHMRVGCTWRCSCAGTSNTLVHELVTQARSPNSCSRS